MNNNDEDCLDKIKNFGKKHLGKMGMALSIAGCVTSVLIGAKFILASGIILGITNVSVFVGSIGYERLSQKFSQVHEENQSLQAEKHEMVRRYSEMPNLQDDTQTVRSDATTETYFEPVVDMRSRYPSIFPDH